MPEIEKNFRKVTLQLGGNPTDDTQWHTCMNLTNNKYAIDKLREAGKLKSGEPVRLSTGLLRNLLIKAQKDAVGFQNAPLGECSHGSGTERKTQAYKFAEMLNRALCEGSSVYCLEEQQNMDLSFPDFED